MMISKPRNAYEALTVTITCFGLLLVVLSYPGLFIFAAFKDSLQREFNLISQLANLFPYGAVLLVSAVFLVFSFYLQRVQKNSISKLVKAIAFLAFAFLFLCFTYR